MPFVADTLLSYFSQYGEVIDCVVMKNQQTGKSRGFGFVTYRDVSCVEAVLSVPSHIVDGRQVIGLQEKGKGALNCYSVTFFQMFFYEICLLHLNTELQIRRGIEDNSEIIYLFLNKNILCDPSLELSHQYVVTPNQNCLDETVLMMGHKICFVEKYG